MANIMITDVCNLNCSYCFANRFVNKNENHITKDAFLRILDFIETAKTKEHIGLIGGEPTLHPDFMDLLSILNSRDEIDDVVVFTNGIKINEFWRELCNPKINLLINCNAPYIIGRQSFEKLRENIRVAINQYGLKERITLGVNIFSETFDYNYILDLIDEFNLDHLRLSITVPNKKEEYNPIEYYSKMKSVVLGLIKDTLIRDAMPYFDCNKIPVCVLSREERLELLEMCGEKAISNIISEYSNCSPVIDILQDETCVRCFGLSDYMRVDITGFETIDDLRGFFENQVDVHAHNTYYDEKCANCYERVCRKCSGGCLQYKISQIDLLTNQNI